MKRIGNLYDRICDFENIEDAFYSAVKGKRDRREVIDFENNLFNNLKNIQRELINETYIQGEFRTFKVYEPKERDIKALPFKDRVVQHAINNIIEPIFTKSFYEHSYACIKGRGVQKASEKMKSCIKDDMFYLKADILKYFKNINKDVLFNIIQSKIKCRSTLNLISNIIYADDDNGIPIGNLTSQLFANVYLNEMDMYIKHELRVKHYFRFMDDIIILDYDINNIRVLYDKISKFINDKLYLKFNNKTVILSVSKGINFVGYIHYKDFKRVKSTTFKRHKKKINKIRKRYDNNNKQLDDNDRASLCSFIGHMKHADTYCLRKKLHKYFNIKFKE